MRAGRGVGGTAVAGALDDLVQAAVKPASPTTSACRRRIVLAACSAELEERPGHGLRIGRTNNCRADTDAVGARREQGG